ncbi:MAG: type II 3-dehydroquinate dehydratase [Bacteroidetes bacterium]|nr:type II 3-dehydroquinate dehydratase [Bacteroidota bacterium]MDA0902831.1 type II 3-dehydroquinate dehydratase [Bacteroidota bacterium]MDA1242016.1 type II 3-dehydroquinate dehydratase [Bacteroidota bacterium]
MKRVITLLHGPNLNLLGARQPEIYGQQSLSDIEATVREQALAMGWEVVSLQSNVEGQLVDWVHQAAEESAGIIVNFGAFSHTSVALRDALHSISIPAVEVHISHIHGREDFRRRTLTAQACVACISGLGARGYEAALHHLVAIQ